MRLWIGLPVIELREGTRLGEVMDIVINRENRATALLIKREGLLGDKGIVELSGIKSIGEDAVTVESPEIVAACRTEEWERCLLTGDRALVGRELFTEDGMILGTVADVYIGEETDNIVGYEVSDGLLADLVSGRKWLPFTETVQIGNPIIVKAKAKLSDLQPPS